MTQRMIMFAAAWLALSAGSAYAAIPNTSDWLHRTTPMISGSVISVDDRQIVVDTDQGQRVTMVMDSHTMLPTDLAPGMVMRAEFRVMENGQYYVNRITPIRDATQARRMEASWQASQHTMKLARSTTTRAYARPTVGGPTVSAEQVAVAEQPLAAEQVVDVSPPNDAPDTLPQTASHQLLTLLLGLLAVTGAGALMLTRRLSRV